MTPPWFLDVAFSRRVLWRQAAIDAGRPYRYLWRIDTSRYGPDGHLMLDKLVSIMEGCLRVDASQRYLQQVQHQPGHGAVLYR